MPDTPDPYEPHRRHVAVAGGRGTVLGLVVTILALDMVFGLSGSVFVTLWPTDDLPAGHWIDATPLGLIATLALFGCVIAALFAIVRYAYHVSPLTLFGEVARLPRDFVRVCKGLFWLNVVLMALNFAGNGTEGLSLRPVIPWLFFALLSLPFILLQTSSEELVYRGFLQQRLGQISAHPMVWMMIPSAIFALTHIGYSGDPIENLFYVLWTFFFGMACADLTARTGSLGSALAFHFVNNAFAFLSVAGAGGPNSGLALWLYPLEVVNPETGFFEADFLPPEMSAPVFMMTLAAQLLPIWMAWITARIALRR